MSSAKNLTSMRYWRKEKNMPPSKIKLSTSFILVFFSLSSSSKMNRLRNKRRECGRGWVDGLIFLVQRQCDCYRGYFDSHEKYHLIFIEKYVQRTFIEQASLEVTHLYSPHRIFWIGKRGHIKRHFCFFPNFSNTFFFPLVKSNLYK